MQLLKTDVVACPYCGEVMNAVGSLQEARPKQGDRTLHFGCGHVLVFTGVDPITYRRATEEEEQAFCASPDGQALLDLCAAVTRLQRLTEGDWRRWAAPREGRA